MMKMGDTGDLEPESRREIQQQPKQRNGIRAARDRGEHTGPGRTEAVTPNATGDAGVKSEQLVRLGPTDYGGTAFACQAMACRPKRGLRPRRAKAGAGGRT
jgi:hypothetical protein